MVYIRSIFQKIICTLSSAAVPDVPNIPTDGSPTYAVRTQWTGNMLRYLPVQGQGQGQNLVPRWHDGAHRRRKQDPEVSPRRLYDFLNEQDHEIRILVTQRLESTSATTRSPGGSAIGQHRRNQR